MQHISESVSINATPSAVWTLLTTPDLILKWFAGIDTIQASPDYPAVGSQISGSYKVMGIELKATQTVQALQPNSAIHYTLEGLVNGTQRWEIAETGSGVTLSMSMDYSMSGGVLGKLAEPAVHQVNLNNAKQSLANIKAMAEG
jgi:carbon monoxide dehydrogenase subunit G